LSELFVNNDEIYQGFTKEEFKSLLNLSCKEPHFLFNEKVYKQIDGCAMGSTIAPIISGVFMSHIEKKLFSSCPSNCKPTLYRRYVDDVFSIFQTRNDAIKFLKHINQLHPNLTFTMEEEENKSLPFLDVLVSVNQDNTLSTSVYRKATFSGLGMNFYSFCDDRFKINSCKTLINRAYNISSSFIKFHNEINFLKDYFLRNCFPLRLFEKQVSMYLNNIFKPKLSVPTVNKEPFYISFPHMGKLNRSFKKDLKTIIDELLPATNVNLIFMNPLKIASLFNHKPKLEPVLTSGVVYQYDCGSRVNRDCGSYIGSTTSLLKVRACSHLGISHRTLCPLQKPAESAILIHHKSCSYKPKLSDFKIINRSKNEIKLRILESLHISKNNPKLNKDISSFPLLLT